MTGIPASIAFVATSVSAAPSNGRSTIASTPSLMKPSIWLIWTLTSFVPSATRSSTSSYFSASASAALVMAPIQPWSAAGAEKPMTIGSPGASLSETAWLEPPPPSLPSAVFSVVGVFDEHAVVIRATEAAETVASVMRRRRVVRADMGSPSMLSCGEELRGELWGYGPGGRGTVGGATNRVAALRGPPRQALLEQHGADDDRALGDLLDRAVDVV